MDQENKNLSGDNGTVNSILWAAIVAGILVAVSSLSVNKAGFVEVKKNDSAAATLENQVLPEEGVAFPVQWGDLGARMASVGVIDRKKFLDLYAKRGGLSSEDLTLLDGNRNGKLVMTRENSGIMLNLLWALGLGNKNSILERGPMTDKRYGGAGGFASTGGWSLSEGDAMDHYSRHKFFELTPEQQALVERVSKNIYRPCCGNPTYFPDCNHGMAMLGLLELMASQGVGESDMYKIALKVNSYWFPDTYITLAKYFEKKGVQWANVDPKEVLGAKFSSAQGYQKVLEEVEPPTDSGGGSCGA